MHCVLLFLLIIGKNSSNQYLVYIFGNKPFPCLYVEHMQCLHLFSFYHTLVMDANSSVEPQYCAETQWLWDISMCNSNTLFTAIRHHDFSQPFSTSVKGLPSKMAARLFCRSLFKERHHFPCLGKSCLSKLMDSYFGNQPDSLLFHPKIVSGRHRCFCQWKWAITLTKNYWGTGMDGELFYTCWRFYAQSNGTPPT